MAPACRLRIQPSRRAKQSTAASVPKISTPKRSGPKRSVSKRSTPKRSPPKRSPPKSTRRGKARATQQVEASAISAALEAPSNAEEESSIPVDASSNLTIAISSSGAIDATPDTVNINLDLVRSDHDDDDANAVNKQEDGDAPLVHRQPQHSNQSGRYLYREPFQWIAHTPTDALVPYSPSLPRLMEQNRANFYRLHANKLRKALKDEVKKREAEERQARAREIHQLSQEILAEQDRQDQEERAAHLRRKQEQNGGKPHPHPFFGGLRLPKAS